MLRLRIRNFQGIIIKWIWTCSEMFTSALVYLYGCPLKDIFLNMHSVKQMHEINSVKRWKVISRVFEISYCFINLLQQFLEIFSINFAIFLSRDLAQVEICQFSFLLWPLMNTLYKAHVSLSGGFAMQITSHSLVFDFDRLWDEDTTFLRWPCDLNFFLSVVTPF